MSTVQAIHLVARPTIATFKTESHRFAINNYMVRVDHEVGPIYMAVGENYPVQKKSRRQWLHASWGELDGDNFSEKSHNIIQAYLIDAHQGL